MCVQQYNSSTAVPQKKTKIKQKSRDRGIWTNILKGVVFKLTLCLSRIERSTAEPKGNVLIPCRLREGNFEKSSLTGFGCCTDIFA